MSQLPTNELFLVPIVKIMSEREVIKHYEWMQYWTVIGDTIDEVYCP